MPASLSCLLYPWESKDAGKNCMWTNYAFGIKGRLHQHYAHSILLFTLILKTLIECFREGIPWKFLFADDLVTIAKTEEELQENSLKW